MSVASADLDAQNFQGLLESALLVLEAEYKEAQRSRTRFKLSIASFVKRHNISRTVLYTKHRHLISLISDKFTELEALKLVDPTKKPSVSSLEAELKSLRKQSKEELANLASATLADFVERCGPAFREKRQLVQEIADLNRQIRELETVVANQASNIQSLMLRLNKKQ